jgi:hypothetical protein
VRKKQTPRPLAYNGAFRTTTSAYQLRVRNRDHALRVEDASSEQRAGKSIDEEAAAVVAEIAPNYPEWGNPSGAAVIARAAYTDAQ